MRGPLGGTHSKSDQELLLGHVKSVAESNDPTKPNTGWKQRFSQEDAQLTGAPQSPAMPLQHRTQTPETNTGQTSHCWLVCGLLHCSGKRDSSSQLRLSRDIISPRKTPKKNTKMLAHQQPNEDTIQSSWQVVYPQRGIIQPQKGTVVTPTTP